MVHHKNFHRLLAVVLSVFAMFVVGTLDFVSGKVYAEPKAESVLLQRPRNIQGPDFIVFPQPPNVQGTIDVALACRNGVIIEFHAVDTEATLDGEPLDWDISFAHDGNLIINQYPIWLAQSATPLVRDDLSFPFSTKQMLLWRGRVPPGPLAMCISGPGTGFCETTVEIDNCYIKPSLVTRISQIGQRNTTSRVRDGLVFETRAYDPRIGVQNGEGIATVAMSIIERVSGEEVYLGDPIVPSALITETRFCLFSADCTPYVFADNEYAWPNGVPIHDGTYLLRAVGSTPRDERIVVQREIEIAGQPASEGGRVNPVDGATYVSVPAGEFAMGSDDDYADVAPTHTIFLDPYWIMEREVTNAQYAACLAAGGCTASPANDLWDDPVGANHPVTNVDWNQAVDYADWVGGRLPTEAEWEKAARGPNGFTYPWGEELPNELLANVDAPTGDTMPVGSYADGASPYGALDMAGNVEEWVADWYGQDYYAESPENNPQGAESSRPPLKVLRGGSFQHDRFDVRSSVRGRANPETKYGTVGFRVVLSEE